jgi:signal transduction histidine kinase
MKIILSVAALTLLTICATAQQESLEDTLRFRKALQMAKHDSERVLLFAHLGEAYRGSKPDSALHYARLGQDLAKQIGFYRGEIYALSCISVVERELGNLSVALETALKGLQLANTYHHAREKAICLIRIGNVYLASGNYRDAISNYISAQKVLEIEPDNFFLIVAQNFTCNGYEELNLLDSADFYIQLVSKNISLFPNLKPLYFRNIGLILSKKGDLKLALDNFKMGVDTALKFKDYRTASILLINEASTYRRLNKFDSAVYYAKQALNYGQRLAYKSQIIGAAGLLADLLEEKDPDQTKLYSKMANSIKDSIFRADRVRALEGVVINEREQQNEIEASKLAYENKIRQYALIAGLATFLIIALTLYRNNRNKQRANKVLELQKREIDTQRGKLEKTLEELKSTQTQLIHSEKMASLGELTAGVAHEIQNPLNFVNNFSELNTELFDEMEHEFKAGNSTEGFAIAENIKQNLSKINQHGKRADAIVKGMLQHSRGSTGQKELTDLNVLAGEYLNLCYHGIRAREKDFVCQVNFNPDPSLSKINIVPQEMGRVFLNLYNNAFYSMREKPQRLKENEEYHSRLNVSTKYINSPSGVGGIEIRVRDNGMGISDKYIEKIFQPFFTTKPTGTGTGLGLSLSYDIITKEHGGTFEVESKEGEYAEFVIRLPLNTGQST